MMAVRRPSHRKIHVWISVCILLFSRTGGSYVPTVTPKDFQKGDVLEVKVNKLTSSESPFTYPYYSLRYCRPERIVDARENLVDFLRSSRVQNSPYKFRMRQPQMCNVVCRLVLNAKDAKEFKEKIDDEYRVNMILEDLPLVVREPSFHPEIQSVYRQGFLVGFKGLYAGSNVGKHFINNHLKFTIKFYNDLETDSVRIVGFEVVPFSVKHEYEYTDGGWSGKTKLLTCDSGRKVQVGNWEPPQEVEEDKEIIFTYDVDFQESDVKWENRWGTYLMMSGDRIHWFSIANSSMIVLFLFGVVAMILLRRCRLCSNRLRG